MTGRPVNLTTLQGGINLQRIKGSARNDTARDLLNGYVDHDGMATSRAGCEGIAHGVAQTVGEVLAVPHGLTAYQGQLYAFCHQPFDWTQVGGADVDTIVLVNRSDPASPIIKVWFVGEYMGLLYVAAEYANGDVIHFWLENVSEWAPDTIYLLGQLVRGTGADSGYVYEANRIGDPYPVWAPDVGRTLSERIEPTTPTGWYYEVSNTVGDAPRSGTIEPIWPQVEGAVVYEDVDIPGQTQDPSAGVPPNSLPPDVRDRYSNPGGINDTRAEQ